MQELKINKKLKNLITPIYAPLSGQLVLLENLSDPIIAIKALGDGIAIEPQTNILVSPCKGTIKLIHSNNRVIIIKSDEDFDILIHIGINSKNLSSSYFKPKVTEGSRVNIGEELIAFNKDAIIQEGQNPTTIVVVNNLDNISGEIITLNKTSKVNSGSDLLYFIVKESANDLPEYHSFLQQYNLPSNNNVSSQSTHNGAIVKEIRVLNESGLHARPAAFLANLAKKFNSTIEIIKNKETGDAKSLIEILGLGIGFKDTIHLKIVGEDANEAMIALENGFKEGLGEKEVSNVSLGNKTANKEVKVEKDLTLNAKLLQDKIENNETSITASGVVIYPNLVIGKAFLIKNDDISVVKNSTLSIEEENNRLNNAINKVKTLIQSYINEAKERNKISQVEIFSAHLEVLNDTFLLNAVKEGINNHYSVEYSFKQAAQKTCNMLEQTGNTLLKERVADIKDIEKNILIVLSGKEITNLSIPENSIIIAEDLTPSKITQFNHNVKGVILAKGSSTAHISIMMKNDGIPSLVGVGEAILKVKENTPIILNSKEGFLIINPSQELMESNTKHIEQLKQSREANLRESKKPAITKDGVKIKVLGNVGGLEQALKAYEKGGEGIGLVRSEFLFMNSSSAPSEEEQYKNYQAICDAMHGESVVVRTLDVGGDKPLAYMHLPSEENPIMGLRGVRNYELNQEIFTSQIRALLRVRPIGICKIMIPMVSELDEILKVKEIINKEKEALGIKEKIQIGIMVEVPSVALLADQFAKHVDFFSLGTNDLAQYILAIDRGHNILTKHLNNLNPALLKAMYFACKGAKKYNISIGVCGAMASEMESIPLLVGLGVNSLSCSSQLIPDVKALIRNLSFNKCQEVALKALDLESQKEVKELVIKEFDEYL